MTVPWYGHDYQFRQICDLSPARKERRHFRVCDKKSRQFGTQLRRQHLPFSRLPNHLAGLLACVLLGVASPVIAAQPDLDFPDLNGKQHSMSEYVGQGKWTVVNILGSGCSSCLEELPELVRFHEEHHRSDATVLGIALDYPSFNDAEPTEVAALVVDFQITFPVLLGTKRGIGQLGAGTLSAMPTTYVFHPEGELVAVQVGSITAEAIENFISTFNGK